MRRVFLLLGACLVMSLVFVQAAVAQQSTADMRANAADTIPLPANGVCPEGYVTVNAPLCAEESPNTPGRIFGYGEGDLALIQQENAPEDAGVVEIAPGGPCNTPALQEDVVGVPVEDLPLAYVNRNDPVGTPISSPLDPDGNGIACDTPAAAGTAIDNGAVAPAQPTTPAQPADEMTALPDTGGPSLQVLALGAGALLVVGGLLLRRRLN